MQLRQNQSDGVNRKIKRGQPKPLIVVLTEFFTTSGFSGVLVVGGTLLQQASTAFLCFRVLDTVNTRLRLPHTDAKPLPPGVQLQGSSNTAVCLTDCVVPKAFVLVKTLLQQLHCRETNLQVIYSPAVNLKFPIRQLWLAIKAKSLSCEFTFSVESAASVMKILESLLW